MLAGLYPGLGKNQGALGEDVGVADFRRRHSQALGFAGYGLLAVVVLTACAGPRLELAATPTQPSVTLTDAGISLTILPNTWTGYPADLGRYYTPVEIRIENDRRDEILVRFGDFLAVDEARNQFRAVEPAEVARALFGGRQRYGNLGRPWGWHRPPPARLLAFHDPWWWRYPYWPYRYWPPFYSPSYPYPYFDPGPPYPWPRTTAYDILTLGLREGRVLPGARVEGFLYLQQATEKGNLLTLSWTPMGADGKSLTTFSSQFRIIR